MGTQAFEERRKKTTLKKIERKHAGKITQPYAIMERLIDEVEAFEALKKARIIIVWKSGWKPTKDDILKHAQIRKLSELEREIWGDEYDLCMLLHRELWQLNGFTGEEREMDIFHELLHPVAEIDDKTGNQKKDDKNRLVWRLRNHPIQRFPEEIARYGIDKVIKLDESTRDLLDDEKALEEARRNETDAPGKRPLIEASEKAATEPPAQSTGAEGWKLHKLAVLKPKLTEKQFDALESTGLPTLGDLQAKMTQHGGFWNRELGVHGRFKDAIETAFNEWLIANS
jgi:hypothetical protein